MKNYHFVYYERLYDEKGRLMLKINFKNSEKNALPENKRKEVKKHL